MKNFVHFLAIGAILFVGIGASPAFAGSWKALHIAGHIINLEKSLSASLGLQEIIADGTSDAGNENILTFLGELKNYADNLPEAQKDFSKKGIRSIQLRNHNQHEFNLFVDAAGVLQISRSFYSRKNPDLSRLFNFSRENEGEIAEIIEDIHLKFGLQVMVGRDITEAKALENLKDVRALPEDFFTKVKTLGVDSLHITDRLELIDGNQLHLDSTKKIDGNKALSFLAGEVPLQYELRRLKNLVEAKLGVKILHGDSYSDYELLIALRALYVSDLTKEFLKEKNIDELTYFRSPLLRSARNSHFSINLDPQRTHDIVPYVSYMANLAKKPTLLAYRAENFCRRFLSYFGR